MIVGDGSPDTEQDMVAVLPASTSKVGGVTTTIGAAVTQ